MVALGRRFAGHDERSRAFGVRPLLAGVERKPTFWAMPAGPFPLDQGQEGACTAFGTAHELAAGPVQVPGMTGLWAGELYRRIQATDRAMGNHWADGASVLAAMKTAQADGLISGYRWCFGIDDVIAALMVAPVCLGLEWRDGSYATDPDGFVRVTGDVVGGHFITAVAYDEHPEWGPVVGWLNSWGPSYGVADSRLGVSGGVGWIRVADLADLLARDGEAVVPADFLQPTRPVVQDSVCSSRFGRAYHRPGAHRWLLCRRTFDSAAGARESGLKPCSWCKP